MKATIEIDHPLEKLAEERQVSVEELVDGTVSISWNDRRLHILPKLFVKLFIPTTDSISAELTNTNQGFVHLRRYHGGIEVVTLLTWS